MLRVEKQQQLDDGSPRHRRAWPRPGSRRSRYSIPPPARRLRIDLFAVERRVWRRGRDIADAQCWASAAITRSMSTPTSFCAATAAPDSISTSSHCPKRSGSSCSSRPGRGRPPQVEIEYGLQLIGRRQRDEIAAVLQSAGLDDPVQHLGLQAGDDLLEVRGVQNALEQAAHFGGSRRIGDSERAGFFTGTADVTRIGPKQTVLNRRGGDR